MVRAVFYASIGKEFDDRLSNAFATGLRAYGIPCEIRSMSEWDGTLTEGVDLGIVLGVKDKSGPIFETYREAGRHAIFIDKGYTRLRGGPLGTLYWRTSVDAFQPLDYLMSVTRSWDRWSKLKIPIVSRRRPGENVVFAGSSQKFCNWHKLGDATSYAKKTLKTLRNFTQRPLVYRPKPSWGDAVPIDGFEYSPAKEKFASELANAHALVTFGSNACFEALISGIPTIVLGNGITRSLSVTRLEDVEAVQFPTYGQIWQLACNVAYCQFTLDEMVSGECWSILRQHLPKKFRKD